METKFVIANCILSFAVLWTAVCVGYLLQINQGVRPGIEINLNESSSIIQPVALSSEQVKDFEKNGLTHIKGLLSMDEVSRLKEARNNHRQRFTLTEAYGKYYYDQVNLDLWRTEKTMATLALLDIPKLVKQVFKVPSFRLLRDAYSSYSPGGAACGWHVDDVTMWPTTNETSGVAVWIALDDMSDGDGGIAVVNTNDLKPRTAERCRRASAIKSTCNMKKYAPDCHKIMEINMIDFQAKAGDAIIMDRWVFHRTLSALTTDKQKVSKEWYSIRYTPEDARASGLIHPSVSRDAIIVDTPYYPRVWPSRLESEAKALEHGLEPDYKLLAKKRMSIPLLLTIAFRDLTDYFSMF